MLVCGGIAQLGECLTGSQEVRGSNPLVSTIYEYKGLQLLAEVLFDVRLYQGGIFI